MVLAIDTSSPIVGVAVRCGTKLLASIAASTQRSSRELLRMIDRALSQAKATVHDLDGLVALRGPGSFTGIRIGLGTIYGLHQALDIPAQGVSTLEVLAAAAPKQHRTVVAAVNAQRGEWFVESFEIGDHRDSLGPPRCLSPESIGEMSPAVIVGHGVHDALGPFVSRGTTMIEPASLAPVALLHWSEPGPDWNPQTLTEPLYCRQAAATEQRKAPQDSKA